MGLIGLLLSCGSKPTTRNIELDRFRIEKYRGYVIKTRNESDYRYDDVYVLKNDSFVVKILLPKYLEAIYSVGDTIK